ncbi:MAG TPA: hypothetical protein VH165_35255 [Kofleriaceae bacterium]|nr:hypothetical protein [Kofleriaceae bacterium]
MIRSLLIVMMLAAATDASDASVWDRALASPADEAAKKAYDAALADGDTATMTSTLQSASPQAKIEAVRRAEAAYRAAAEARPRESEPYFRIGNLVYQTYFECEQALTILCDPVYATPKRAEIVIDAWDEFERRVPLDPRVGEILLRRAILNTKLVNGLPTDHARLESAARDYRAAIDRSDGLLGTRGDEQLLGNLAETLMMLNQLDDAIATYLQAVTVGAARVSTVYGLAVALDRNGEGEQALRRIQGQGEIGLESFTTEFMRQAVFFVPAGESHYYFALANEAFGNDGAALGYWNLYLASGAHPEFQPRAREHVEQLRKRHVRPAPPPPFRDDPN